MRRKNICRNNKTYDDVVLIVLPIFPLVFPVKSKRHKKKKLSEQTNKFCNRRREGEIDLPFAHAFIVRQMSDPAPKKVC